jgi:hypothetical protein
MTGFRRLFISVLCGLTVQGLRAQGMDHAKMPMDMKDMKMDMAGMMTPPSQAAFATIQAIVHRLKADSTTNWSKVNLEGVRQHLIDMDNVFMRSAVKQSNVPGGMSLDITGTGDVAGAIKRMVGMHATALSEEGNYVAKSSELPNGMRLIVTAKKPSDAKTVAMIRGLGFAGILTEGDHHTMHHMMMAKGEPMMMHERKP